MKKIKLNDFLAKVLEKSETDKLSEYDFMKIVSKFYINELNPKNKFYLLFSFTCLIKSEDSLPTFASRFENNLPELLIPTSPEVWNHLVISKERFYDILKHEISHLVALHSFRLVEFIKKHKNFEPENLRLLANLITDALINEQGDLKTIKNICYTVKRISEDIKIPEEKILKMPFENIAEEYLKNAKFVQVCQIGQGKQSEQNEQKENSGQSKQDVEFTKDVLNPENSSEEGSRESIKKIIESAQKSIGKLPGEIEEIIKNWKKIQVIKINFNKVYGKLRELDRTFTYPSQYNLIHKNSKFVLPAYKKLEEPEILLIIDTSGSIGQTEFELFFGIIKKIAEKYPVDICEIDTEIKPPIIQIKQKDLKEFKFKGRGGTSFKNLEKIKEFTKKNYKVVIILTDGYVDEFPKNNPIPSANWYLFYTEKCPKVPKFIEPEKIENVVISEK